ncbi:MAG: hypothetical protein ABSG43_29670 [Solirubrobacteraceae bacterium]
MAALLAERFAAVVPSAISVAAQSCFVDVAGSRIDTAFHVKHSEFAGARTVCDVAVMAMEVAADAVAEATRDPWPAAPGQFPGGFASCHAEIVAESVRLWFGAPTAPILELEPMPIHDVLA